MLTFPPGSFHLWWIFPFQSTRTGTPSCKSIWIGYLLSSSSHPLGYLINIFLLLLHQTEECLEMELNTLLPSPANSLIRKTQGSNSQTFPSLNHKVTLGGSGSNLDQRRIQSVSPSLPYDICSFLFFIQEQMIHIWSSLVIRPTLLPSLQQVVTYPTHFLREMVFSVCQFNHWHCSHPELSPTCTHVDSISFALYYLPLPWWPLRHLLLLCRVTSGLAVAWMREPCILEYLGTGDDG